MAKRFKEMANRYSGEIRLIPEELKQPLGSGRTIFIEHMNDLFANGVESNLIHQVLEHCREYPGNTYVFQTKNPSRLTSFRHNLPTGSILGTTIETNRRLPDIMKNVPHPIVRAAGLGDSALRHFKRFVTIEPILDFDLETLINLIVVIDPAFINIGADSKGINLPEPSKEKVVQLLQYLKTFKYEVRQKTNLERLLA